MRTGIRSRQGPIVVVGAPGRPGLPRVGFVVSRGVGTAVRRNRLKRRLRHAVRALRLEPDMDYVIIASTEATEIPHPRLTQLLQSAVDALGTR